MFLSTIGNFLRSDIYHFELLSSKLWSLSLMPVYFNVKCIKSLCFILGIVTQIDHFLHPNNINA